MTFEGISHPLDLEPAPARARPCSAITARTRSASWAFGERHHDDHVGKADLLARLADGAALEGKAVAVAGVVIARGAAEAEHQVLFPRLEGGAADQVGVFVGLEVAEADNHRVRVKGRGQSAMPSAGVSTK